MTEALTVTIETLAHKGDGVVTINGEPHYIPYTLPSEEVALTREGGGTWRLDSILKASPARIAASCHHFGSCGGCALQHFQAESYLAWKKENLRQTLSQRGFENTEIAEVCPIPPQSRRRLVLSAAKSKSRVVLGFNKARQHEIEDLEECPVALPGLVKTFDDIRAILNAALRAKDQGRVTVNWTDHGADVLVETKKRFELAANQVASLAQLSSRAKLSRLTWNGDMVYQAQPPQVSVDGIRVVPPPGAFLQASEEAQNVLVERVQAATSGAKRVADLFCGIGTFALPVSRYANVTAFDSAAEMIDALTKASNEAGIGNKLNAQRRDLFKRPVQASEFKNVDMAILDPPRVGALEQAKQLALSDLQRIVYVSCNPATFARDARFLVNEGFQMGTVQPIDQFLWSPHTELIAVFDR